MTDADWGAIAVTKAPGFDRAKRIVEFGAGDFSRSMALAERYPAKAFLSTDHTFGAEGTANLQHVEQLPNLDVAQLDARAVDLPAGSVDFMFSIALMEHIAELDACLEAVHRALSPGGVYFYIQAPFWTCSQGHHFRHDDDRTYEFIPKYSHLTNDRAGLAELLRNGPEPPFDIDGCVDYIYTRPDLSPDSSRRTPTCGRRHLGRRLHPSGVRQVPAPTSPATATAPLPLLLGVATPSRVHPGRAPRHLRARQPEN